MILAQLPRASVRGIGDPSSSALKDSRKTLHEYIKRYLKNFSLSIIKQRIFNLNLLFQKVILVYLLIHQSALRTLALLSILAMLNSIYEYVLRYVVLQLLSNEFNSTIVDKQCCSLVRVAKFLYFSNNRCFYKCVCKLTKYCNALSIVSNINKNIVFYYFFLKNVNI